MKPTPSMEQLIDFVAGDLAGPDAAALEAAIAADPRLAAIVASYRFVQSVAATDDTVEPPADTVARGIAIFDPRRLPARESWWRNLERVVASLVLDSRQQTLGLRYADGGDRYQLTFRADDLEIDVQIERPETSRRRWRVTGQVDETSPAVAVAASPSGAAAPVAEASVAEGIFTLELEGGRYDLLVSFPDRILVLPDLALE